MTDITFPTWLAVSLGALLGLIAGSFAGAIYKRWPNGQSVIGGRSECDDCGVPLTLIELVPLLSYSLQSGRCRQCGASIDANLLLMEIACALVGAIALFVSPNATGLSGAIFGWLLVLLGALDAKHLWLPDRLTAALAITGLGAAFVVGVPTISDRLVGGATGLLSFLLIAVLFKILRRKDGLGFGDAKLFGAIGCWLGWQALPFLLLGASVVGLASVALSATRSDANIGGDLYPLGAYLSVAAFPLWIVQVGGLAFF